MAVFIVVVTTLFERWRLAHEQEIQAVTKAADLDQQLRQFAVLPVILSEDPRLHQALTEPSTDSHLVASKVLQHVAIESDAAFAFLMDVNGLTVAASNFDDDVSFVGNNYGFRPYFKQAIVGESSTFFAVGATTGIPGYFVSEPIFHNGKVIGVVVIKLEPSHLPVSWNEGSAIALVTDELGVVILSSQQNILYSATKPLQKKVLSIIETDRRYQVAQKSRFEKSESSMWHLSVGDASAHYIVGSRKLAVEPWTLSVLTPHYTFILRVLVKLAVLAGIIAIAGLIWKIWSQQAQLSRERGLLANRLEHQVEERTRELEQMQNDMIAQSNFAMLGRMSAAINHEVNQPLSSLRFNLAALRQMIEKNDPVEKDQQTNLQNHDSIESTVVDLDRTAKRITRVIESLRALPNRQNTDLSEIVVTEFLSETVETVERERPLMSRYLCYRDLMQDRQIKINGERILMQQAILNVLYNAFDAVADLDNPVILLDLSVSGETVNIIVSDNGAGVPSHLVPRMFEPFESNPEKISGLGLGLTLARQIVNDHGGKIVFERRDKSEALSVFTITLPLLPRAAPTT